MKEEAVWVWWPVLERKIPTAGGAVGMEEGGSNVKS